MKENWIPVSGKEKGAETSQRKNQGHAWWFMVLPGVSEPASPPSSLSQNESLKQGPIFSERTEVGKRRYYRSKQARVVP